VLDRQTPFGQTIHLSLDPVSLHRSAEVAVWLADRPWRRFVSHGLPTHASWLSFVEAWFAILSKKGLTGAELSDFDAADRALTDFIATHDAHPAIRPPGARASAAISASKASSPHRLRRPPDTVSHEWDCLVVPCQPSIEGRLGRYRMASAAGRGTGRGTACPSVPPVAQRITGSTVAVRSTDGSAGPAEPRPHPRRTRPAAVITGRDRR
jgi:hypothetical protein